MSLDSSRLYFRQFQAYPVLDWAPGCVGDLNSFARRCFDNVAGFLSESLRDSSAMNIGFEPAVVSEYPVPHVPF